MLFWITEDLKDICLERLILLLLTNFFITSVKSIRTCPPQSLNGPSSASRTGKGDKFHSGGKVCIFE